MFSVIIDKDDRTPPLAVWPREKAILEGLAATERFLDALERSRIHDVQVVALDEFSFLVTWPSE